MRIVKNLKLVNGGLKSVTSKIALITMLFIDPPKLYRCLEPDKTQELPDRVLKNGLDLDQHPPDWLH